MTARQRRAQEAAERANEPVVHYCVAPRAVVVHAATWDELVAGAKGLHFVRRRDADKIPLGPDEALVYEGAPGQVWVARQNW